LIERHCKDDPIPYPLHCAYHDATQKLQADVLAFFSGVKTYLNGLTVFIKDVLPQRVTRGLRFKGFGALVASASRITSGGELLAGLREFLASEGAAYYKDVLEWRNKHVEHPSGLSDMTVLSGPGRLSLLISGGRRAPSTEAASSTTDYGDEEVLVIRTESGAEVFTYHLVVRNDLEQGMAVEKGDSLGVACDSTGRHFATFGPHMHVFAAGDAVSGAADLARPETADCSPDAYNVMARVIRISRGVLEGVTEALRGTADGDMA